MAEHWLNAARITRVHGFSFWAWQTLLLTPLPMAVPRSPGRAETVLSGAVQHPAGGLQISRTAGSRHAPSGAPRPPLPVACLLCPSKAWPDPASIELMHAQPTFFGVLPFFRGNTGNKLKKHSQVIDA